MVSTTQTPVLLHRAEFEAALPTRPNDDSIRLLHEVPSVWITGTSNSGRNTLITELEKSGDYYYPISDTTRPMRENDGVMEQNGQFYWHITEEEFLSGLQKGKYIEAAIIHNRQVSGVNISGIEKAASLKKIILRDVEINGIIAIHEYIPESIFIFMLPPAFKVLMERFHKRSNGKMSKEEIYDRIRSGHKEISIGLKCGFLQFMVSSDLRANVKLVDDLVKGKITELPDQEEAHAHAEQLLIDMEEFLQAA